MPLTLLLFILLLVTLLSIQARPTLLNASYYSKVVAEANLYDFLLTDVTSSAVDEARGLNGDYFPGSATQNPLVSLGFSPEAVTSTVNNSFPPLWLRSNSEIVLEQIVGYVVGQHDEFNFTIQTGEQVEVFASEFKILLGESETYDVILNGWLVPSVARLIVGLLPVDLNITNEHAEAYVVGVIPKEWFVPQVEAAIDELTPYLIGRNDTFKVIVPLDERADIALQEIKVLLRDSDSYESLYVQLVEPQVDNSFGDSIQLPYGIVVTKDEVLAGMREVTPPSWIQVQTEQIIDDSTPYFKGEVNSFESELFLVDNKLAALQIIGETANRKLNENLRALPPCASGRSLTEIISLGSRGTIDCLPANTPITLVAGLISNQVTQAVEERIGNVIPDSIVFTQDDLQKTLTQAGLENGADILQALRSNISTGIVYTEDDLTQDIGVLLDDAEGEDTLDSLNGLRTFLAEGWTYTDADFRKDLFELDGGETLQQIDSVRPIFKRIRLLAWILVLPIIFVISGIGYLGGYDLRTRVGWASGSLIAASVFVFLFMLTLYGFLVEPRLNGVTTSLTSAIAGGESFTITRSLLAEKITEIIQTISDDFGAGVANKSLITLFLGIVGLGVSLSWEYIAPLLRRTGVQRLIRR